MSRHGTCGASATRTRAGAGDSGARLSCQGLVSRVFLKRFGVTWIFEAKLVSGSSDASEICMCFSRSACQAVGLETEVPVSPAARQPGLLPFHCGDPAGTPVHCPAPLPLRGLCGERREQSHLRWPPWPCSAGLALVLTAVLSCPPRVSGTLLKHFAVRRMSPALANVGVLKHEQCFCF